MAASCALLSAGAARSQEPAAAPAHGGFLDDWSVDSALAYYHEDGRVQAVEPVVDVSKVFADGQSVSLNATFDALSGASPNGALPSRSPQTFASPSGKARHAYTIAPGQLPADPNYSDARFAAGGNWTKPLTRTDELSLGGKFSAEDDFVSATVNASIAHDFNDKNTTLSFGVFNEFDSLHPVGDTPVPGSDFASQLRTGSKTKDGVGALLGITQVMTRNWLTEFNLSVDRFTGYLNDPYKITSIIDSAGNTTGYEYENRPDQRTRKSAYWENRVAWTSQLSTGLSLRYMSDDWAVRSDTAELHLHWSLSNRERYIEPSIRWYRQTAANFYTPFILDTLKPATNFESADDRLGAFRALTYGVKYAQKLPGLGNRSESEFSVRAEYYQQTFNERVPVPAGLQGLDLYPALKAILVQIGYRF
ncbi:MAG TPA: DUF3570 domain-containing protein [Steroidobacteraceae bacterium]|jgi:hypothetical protein|nr:DUF3570 domain-containing protein [Steroidobacteraceae bacterium]